MKIEDAQRQLAAMWEDSADVHVTLLAAACLRAVDAKRLGTLFAEGGVRGRYRTLVEAAERVILASQAPGHILCHDDKRALAGLSRGGDAGSLFARAVAQAIHRARHRHFWSYFAAWTEPRCLVDGDPVPVPTRTRLDEIYAAPRLRCCPSPDLLQGPDDLCSGGYRGLPSLRLLDRPAGCSADVYLDPSLPEALRRLSAGISPRSPAAYIVPH